MQANKKSYISIILGAIFISFSPVLIKATGAPGTITSFYRLLIGSLVLIVPFLISFLRNKKKLSTKGIALAALAGFLLAIDMALWTTGIMASNAALPTLVGNLASVWVGIGSVLIFKEKQTLGFWLGLLIALAGVTFLMLRDFYFPTGMFKGLLLGLLAGVFYAGFMLVTQKGRAHLNTISYLFFSSVATTIFLGIFALVLKEPFTGYSLHTWQLFLVMGVFIQAGAWFLINYAQGYLPASLITPTLLAQPVLAAVIAWFMLGEALSVWHIVGGVVVIVGIYIVHFSSIKKKA